MRLYVIPAVAGLAVIGIAACSPDEGDFKSDAEDFIEEDDGEVENQLNIALDEATCEDPTSSDVGTVFNCTAAGDDGNNYEFFVEITGDNSYEVGGGTVAGGTTPGGTTPGGTTGGTAPTGTGTTVPSATTEG